ncbi:hypothetical protein TWF788_009376 [Orbilia oligospora]|uniref:F-box domain-containing protein n=1 Tax=Orbilia oligospora TaxID=2813651 RepID=A0A6G1LYH8_ORBOL|nr:hypothetical protein TWF788_009376 [Orbilia oligospora]KAF3219658.1 hypothetical protein TWF191_007638 [Orbilia oligospora]KAF3238506.1 hypothetical protein TWF192_010340 [Orbilia oligospora]
MTLSENPLSHFQILAPELVFQICSYLDNKDLPNLLPTCRYLHHAVSGYLHDETSKATLQTLLEAKSNNFYGIEFIRKTQNGGDDTTIGLGVLVKAIEALLKEKNKAVIISFKVNSESVKPEGHRDLLLALKAFSYTRPANQFAINPLTVNLDPLEVARIFDVRKLTRLNLTFHVNPWNKIPKYDSGVLDVECTEYRDGTIEYRQSLREKAYEEYNLPSPEILEDISGLNKLLTRTQNLEHLQLYPMVLHYKKFRPLEDLPSELEELGNTFKNLKRLRSLELDEFLFHVSFFLPVPENLERLQLKNTQYYSKAWWLQFARYKFTNLKELYIDYDPIFRQYSMYESDTSFLHRDGTLKTQDEIDNGFKLENVEVQSLERFIYERAHASLFNKHFCFPADLVPCVVRRNEGLESKIKRALVSRYAEEVVERCRERLERVIGDCRDAIKGELVTDFLEGGFPDDGLEKCLSSYGRYVLGKPRPAV